MDNKQMKVKIRLSRFPPLKKDKDGKYLCRGCGSAVPAGRKTWCSRQCYIANDPQTVILNVLKRDKGVCKHCGVDTVALRKECMGKIGRIKIDCFSFRVNGLLDYAAFQKFKSEAISTIIPAGFRFCKSKRWWQADHIIEFSRGGPTTLENMQTLCLRCHKEKTRKFRNEKGLK